MHPQAGCSTGPQSFKSFLRLLRANCLALCSDQCPGGGCRLAGIILNCYQLVTRHPTPAAQPAKCPPEAKQVSRKANYVKCKTNSGRKNNGGAELRSYDMILWNSDCCHCINKTILWPLTVFVPWTHIMSWHFSYSIIKAKV